MSFTPKLIGPTIVLPDSLAPLVETLAENNHNSWALQRTSEGWTFGPVRDSSTKTHEGLVPFEELPESEKEVDRELVRSMLRAMVELGYRIDPPDESCRVTS